MSKQTTVTALPNCDLPHVRNVVARYDAYIPSYHTWGYVCATHFKSEGCQTGTGLGQELVVAE